MKKKVVLYQEFVYIFTLILMSFSVALAAGANFGLSMIVCPAYIFSQIKFGDFSFTFGQSEYIIQLIALIILFIIVRKFKFTYFFSFITALLYGAVLDFFQAFVPFLMPSVTATYDLWLRIILFIVSTITTALSVALFFKVYLCPEVYDLVPKEIVAKYHTNETITKYAVDFTFLIVSLIMCFTIFHKLVGIYIGTGIIVLVNGFIIGFFSKTLDKLFEFKPLFPKVEKFFKEH